MISELSIDIARYVAFLDDTSLDPNYLVGEFLEDFQLLPTSFFNPGQSF